MAPEKVLSAVKRQLTTCYGGSFFREKQEEKSLKDGILEYLHTGHWHYDADHFGEKCFFTVKGNPQQ